MLISEKFAMKLSWLVSQGEYCTVWPGRETGNREKYQLALGIDIRIGTIRKKDT